MILCNASWRLVILGGLATYKFSSKSDCSKNFRKRLAKSLINKLKNLRNSTAHSHPYLWLPIPEGTVAAEVQLSLNTAIKMQIDYQTLCDIYTLSFQCFTDFNARVCWENYLIMIQNGIYMPICFIFCGAVLVLPIPVFIPPLLCPL